VCQTPPRFFSPPNFSFGRSILFPTSTFFHFSPTYTIESSTQLYFSRSLLLLRFYSCTSVRIFLCPQLFTTVRVLCLSSGLKKPHLVTDLDFESLQILPSRGHFCFGIQTNIPLSDHRKQCFNPHHGFLRWWTSPWLLQLCVYPTFSHLRSTNKSSIHCLAHPTSVYMGVLQRLPYFKAGIVACRSTLLRFIAE
jgi:hypothetical protein